MASQWILALCAVVAIGFSATACQPTAPTAAASDANSGASADGLSVATVVVEEQTVPRYLNISGSLVAENESQIAAGVSGKVVAQLVERGSLVAAGAPLFKLDSRVSTALLDEARAQLELARAQRDLANAECARDEQLHKEGAISASEWQRRVAQCKVARASAEAVESRLNVIEAQNNDTIIRAPFAGVVAEKLVNIGEYVQANTHIATLVSVAPLRLELTVPEAAAADVKKGQEVEYWLAGNSQKIFTTEIKFVSNWVRRNSRDMIVEAVLNDPDATLRPGMFVQARISLGEQILPVVPRSALRNDGDSHRVFVVENGKLQERLVQIGTSVGEQISIVNALKKGERLVQVAGPELRDGIKVQ